MVSVTHQSSAVTSLPGSAPHGLTMGPVPSLRTHALTLVSRGRAVRRYGATACVNSVALLSRNECCQSSRRWGTSSRCRKGTGQEDTPPGWPRVPRESGSLRQTPHCARRMLAGNRYYSPLRGLRMAMVQTLAWHRRMEPADARAPTFHRIKERKTRYGQATQQFLDRTH